MLSEEQKKKFREFYESARRNDILDGKTTVMVHLAAAMAVACYPCMRHYFNETEDVGITEEEIGAIQSIVMAVSAGRVKAQVHEVLSES